MIRGCVCGASSNVIIASHLMESEEASPQVGWGGFFVMLWLVVGFISFRSLPGFLPIGLSPI